ncbi:hypothetical protein DKX38_028709 [Salix brachista]|uniref:Squalene cyclase N-terminal domain-containing protein n=1 Tax=Salix brachista TaxID=2182728 RepID=A0A5N5JBD8_9ROSI|nr:hypothetical protein DKX38_028709 [Salix brachista]
MVIFAAVKFEKENPVPDVLPQVKVKESEEVTEEAVTATVKRALNFYSSIQARSFNRRQQVLGVFEWSGNNPMPPEMWLLPYLLPVHPGRMWCHCRMVYLPMSYLYGKRFVGPITPTVLSLRKELFAAPYHEIDWNQARNLCAKVGKLEDLYYPHPLVQDALWALLDKTAEPVLMHWPGKKLREKALHTAMEHIHYEDENTRYICIGPVNKVLNMLCCWVEDPNSESFKLHLPRIQDYLWLAEDGMKMQGYNGSQLWDASFAVQAIISTNLVEEFGPTLRKAHTYIKNSQVLEDCPGDLSFWYRHISKGAWPFSTADHGWPISDCTAEGLKAALLLSKITHEIVGEPLVANRFYDAVNVILSLQCQRRVATVARDFVNARSESASDKETQGEETEDDKLRKSALDKLEKASEDTILAAMAESEKLVALKKTYADIILNTAKEAPNRVMEYERQALRCHNNLCNSKDEALRLLFVPVVLEQLSSIIAQEMQHELRLVAGVKTIKKVYDEVLLTLPSPMIFDLYTNIFGACYCSQRRLSGGMHGRRSCLWHVSWCLNFGRFDEARKLAEKAVQWKTLPFAKFPVCSNCPLRSSCESGYLLTNKEDEARTIDLMRVLLAYGFDSINGSVANTSKYVLGVFEWSGNNPMPPEMWLLPYLLPVHPGTMML